MPRLAGHHGNPCLTVLYGFSPSEVETVREALLPSWSWKLYVCRTPEDIGGLVAGRVDRFAEPPVAGALAMAALRQVRRSTGQPDAIGLACMKCDPPVGGDGQNSLILAAQTVRQSRRWTVRAEPPDGDQTWVERTAPLLRQARESAETGCGAHLDTELLRGGTLEDHGLTAPAPWRGLLWGQTERVARPADPSRSEISQRLIFPGSFHPPHEGHRRMKQFAESMLQMPAALEISVENVEKPTLDYLEIDERLGSLGGQDVWLTRAPTFLQKALLFPGATFILGSDTVRRLASPDYYHSAAEMQRVCARIAAAGCRLLVFGRVDRRRFATIDQLEMPHSLRAICRQVPESAFRHDISSTELRRGDDRPG